MLNIECIHLYVNYLRVKACTVYMHIELMSWDLCVNFPIKLIDFHRIEFILLLSWYFCGVFVVTGTLILSLNNP